MDLILALDQLGLKLLIFISILIIQVHVEIHAKLNILNRIEHVVVNQVAIITKQSGKALLIELILLSLLDAVDEGVNLASSHLIVSQVPKPIAHHQVVVI